MQGGGGGKQGWQSYPPGWMYFPTYNMAIDSSCSKYVGNILAAISTLLSRLPTCTCTGLKNATSFSKCLDDLLSGRLGTLCVKCDSDPWCTKDRGKLSVSSCWPPVPLQCFRCITLCTNNWGSLGGTTACNFESSIIHELAHQCDTQVHGATYRIGNCQIENLATKCSVDCAGAFSGGQRCIANDSWNPGGLHDPAPCCCCG